MTWVFFSMGAGEIFQGEGSWGEAGDEGEGSGGKEAGIGDPLVHPHYKKWSLFSNQ